MGLMRDLFTNVRTVSMNGRSILLMLRYRLWPQQRTGAEEPTFRDRAEKKREDLRCYLISERRLKRVKVVLFIDEKRMSSLDCNCAAVI